MRAPGKVLVFGGVLLATFGMLYGLWYALALEHQTLNGMGVSLSRAFAAAAERRSTESEDALAAYGKTKCDYLRQVDVHSHWIGLAMLLIVLGMAFEKVGFAERTRLRLALALLTGSVVFPLGVILETARVGAAASGLAVSGSVLVIGSLAVIAVGFARKRAGDPA
ncbi:MAG: hypothetical protein JOZ14_01720 [Acidobacteria bacterium]|nr:hypothetical protein [Acidobacteriota bacterium]